MDGRPLRSIRPARSSCAQDRHDAAGAVHVLHVHVRLGRGHLAQHRHLAAERVDVVHREVDPALVGGGAGCAAPCWWSRPWRCRAPWRSRTRPWWRSPAAARRRRPARSSRLASSTISRPASSNRRLRSAWVARVEPLPGRHRPSASVRQFIELAVNMPEQEPQVGQADLLDGRDLGVGILVVRGRHHGVDQVERADLALHPGLAGLHRPAGDEHDRDVEPHRGHQHARRDLVAVRDAHHRVGAMGVDHVLDAVRDQVAARAASTACRRGPSRCRRRPRWC